MNTMISIDHSVAEIQVIDYLYWLANFDDEGGQLRLIRCFVVTKELFIMFDFQLNPITPFNFGLYVLLALLFNLNRTLWVLREHAMKENITYLP